MQFDKKVAEKWLGPKNWIWITFPLLIVLIFFQNCSTPKFEISPEELSSKTRSENNGYGYNGKLQFIKVASSGMCPDGLSRAEIQISVRYHQDPFPDAAFVEREDCLKIPPKVLKLGDEALLAKDFQSLTYKTGTSSILLVRDLSAVNPVVAGSHLYVSPTGSDLNPGTQSQPFMTIQKAADSAGPGATVHVAPGVYAETVDVKNSGTEEARIRIVSDVKWGAKIRPASVITELWKTSGDYVDLVGFEIDGTGSPGVYRGIGLTGNHTSVQYNHIHHIALSTPCDFNGASGVYAYGGNTAQIDEHIIGNTVHDIGSRSCLQHRAIMHSGTGSIINNLIYNAPDGIDLWHNNHHILIANNTLFNNTNGIFIGSGDYTLPPAPSDYITTINNIVVHTTQTAFKEDNTSVGAHNIFSNNLIFANGADWALATGRVPSNSIAADPLFINYLPDGTGNYHLQNGSPAIDQGLATNAPALDIEGASRLLSPPDVGAFEWFP